MFTGIIKYVGIVQESKTDEGSSVLVVNEPSVAGSVEMGSSVAVQGVCLTVNHIQKDAVGFGVMDTTIEKTTVSDMKPGDRVNMETALRMGDEVGGHFVYGHVDGVGTVAGVEVLSDATLLSIMLPQELMRRMVLQGAVTVDGVSLTVAQMNDISMTVSLVEYTLQHTTLGVLEPGMRVNIETDRWMEIRD